eukprot:602862-Rhodomonas_salina.1
MPFLCDVRYCNSAWRYLATRCRVLKGRTAVIPCYEMSGTDGVLVCASGLCVRYAMSGTDVAYAGTVLCDIWYSNSVWCYHAMRYLVLNHRMLVPCYAKSGTKRAYGGTRERLSSGL